MKEIKILEDAGMTFWAKKGEDSYSRNIKDLLNYLGIKYIDESSHKSGFKNN